MSDRRRLGHVPALDGLRGVAVAAVVVFHSGYPWASGGFLGVSVFFTLSGFLITSLLLAEQRAEGRVALGAFYRRRAARLLPASLLGLLLALAVGRASAVVATGLRGDLLAGAAQGANWRWLLTSQSYQDLFASPSPVLHYWSLAIEEQFYLLFPPLAAWALARSLPRLRWIVAVGLAGSWVLLVGLVAAERFDAAYYATPARLGEILAGCLLGCLAGPGDLARRVGRATRLGLPAALVLLAAVALVDPTARWTYAVWLPATSALTLLVIVGASGSGGLAVALAWRPLVGLGRISYGVYVYHWPIFLYLTPARTGLGPHVLTGVRVVATVGLALLSHRLIEAPLLDQGRRPHRARAVLVPVAAWSAVAVAMVVGTTSARPVLDLRATAAALEAPPVVAAATLPPEVPHVAFFGDSTALMTVWGLEVWGRETGRLLAQDGETTLGCGLELPGERRDGDAVYDLDEKCFRTAEAWPGTFAATGADVGVIMTGVWEAKEHRLPGDPVWRHLGDPVLDAAYLERFGEAADTLLRAGAQRVVWITSPTPDLARTRVNARTGPDPEVARIRRLNELVVEVAAARPQVAVVDLAAWLDARSDAVDAHLRPDGVHFSTATSAEVAEQWLGDQLLAALHG